MPELLDHCPSFYSPATPSFTSFFFYLLDICIFFDRRLFMPDAAEDLNNNLDRVNWMESLLGNEDIHVYYGIIAGYG